METGGIDDAGTEILYGIKSFPAKKGYFSEIGQEIVEASGNRELRWQIEAAIRGQT